MGLLDSLFSGGSGSGANGGLLDFLRSNGMNQSPTAGLPSDQAQYAPAGPMFAPQPTQQANAIDTARWPVGPVGAPSQMPVLPANQPNALDNAQWPVGPVGAPSQANAQMPVPQQPPAVVPAAPEPAAAPAAPGFFDRLNAGLQSMGHGGSLIGAATGNYTDPATIAKAQAAQVANVTARALLAKGVDPAVVAAAVAPGNGELLKTLWEANFKTKDPMNMGSGYVLRPGAAKAERLFEPDEKTPAGFVKGDDGNMHFIPGGPADPAYLRLAEAQKKDPNGNYVLGRGGEVVKNNPDGTVTVLHKNETPAEPMDPAALEILARREIGGDFSGRNNLGRGAQGASDLKAITNKSSEILTKEMGKTPAEAAAHMLKQKQEYNAQGQGLNAEARTTGVREANLNLILKATAAAIPAALEASEKVSRTGWVPLNKIIQSGQVATSDTNLRQFGMANIQLAEHWARAMNPTGVMRGEDRDLALGFLGTADSKDTYRALVGQLQKQIERERDAVKSSRGMAGMPGATAPSTAAPLQPGESTKIGDVSIKRVN